MQYKVPQHIDKNKVFLVNFSEINGRLDPQFYKEHFNFENFNKLSYVAKVNGGKRIPLGENYSNEKTDYLYLRVADINNEGIVNFATLKYISYDLYEELKRYEIYNGDVAISIAGTIGKIVYINGIPQNKHVILTENCAKFKLINDNILAEYLKIVLELPIVQKQIKLNYIQTTIPKLGLDKIYSLMLPPFPDKEKQQNIINHFNAGRFKKFQKEQEAAAKLNSIDDYLLRELGITMPNTQIQTLEDRTFIVYFSDVIGSRFDPQYNSSIKLIYSLKSNYCFKTLGDVIIEKSGQYGANEEATEWNDGDTRYIRITDIDELGNLKPTNKKSAATIENKYLLKYNDVLFARSGSVGKCYIHKDISDKSIFAGYLIRFKLNIDKINSDFLFYYCNSKLYWMWVEAIQRPSVQSNINSEEFKSMPIPLPPLSKQQEIVEHISQLRAEAKRLQEEGAEILRKAKEDIEKMIIE